MGFDDTAWNSGPSGFGFGDGDDAKITPANQTAIFTRIIFTMADLANLTSLILDVDYDDGFVAYINGVEVARANESGAFQVMTPALQEVMKLKCITEVIRLDLKLTILIPYWLMVIMC